MSEGAIHPLHAPDQRVVVSMVDDWELRQFAESDARHAYFATRGFAHLQLWHPAARVSIVTPSRLTDGHFEAWLDGDRIAARSWSTLELELAMRGVPAPGRHTIRAIERWFVLASETGAGRLLRTWWAGAAQYS